MLFIGGIFPRNSKQDIVNNSKGPIQFAANTLQYNIIKGLEANLNQPIDIINAVFIGSYPKFYKKLIYKKSELENKHEGFRYDLGFLNVFILKHVVRALGLKRYLYKWYKTNPTDKRIVIYSMHWPFIFAASKLKRKFKDCNIVLIIPDLPEYMSMDERKKPILAFLKKIDTALIFSKLKYIDSFALLTEHMREKLNVTNKPYVVIEGMCDPNDVSTDEIAILDKEKNDKIILYSGSLHRKYGILILLEAFSLIKNKNYKLWICGDGDAKEDVIKAANINPQIKFFGQVHREEVLKLQSQSTVLVNPRSGSEAYTKYSFPSKTIEYLLAAKPVIMDRLSGIPFEYNDYIFFVNDYSALGFANKIVEICNKSDEELSVIGLKGRRFIIEEKNYKVQCKRIIDLANVTNIN